MDNYYEFVNKLQIHQIIFGEILKSHGLITDYNCETELHNFQIASNGVLEYDICLKQTVIPKIPVQEITIEFVLQK